MVAEGQGPVQFLRFDPVSAAASSESGDQALKVATLAGRSGAGYSVGGQFGLHSFGWSPHSAILNLNAPVLPALTVAGVQRGGGGSLLLASLVGRVGGGYGVAPTLGLASFGWSPQSPVIDSTPSFGGFEHRALGEATLAPSPTGGLTVGQLGFPGQDGVAILLPGNVGGAGVRFAPDSFPFSGNGPNNARFELTIRDSSGAILGLVEGVYESSSGFKVRATFGRETGADYSIRVLGDPRGPFSYLTQNWTMWWSFWPREIRAFIREDGGLQLDVGTDNIPGLTASGRVYVNPPGTSFGQLVYPSIMQLISRPGLVPLTTRLGALELRFGSAQPNELVSRRLSDEWVERFDRRIHALGQTGFRSSPDGLNVVGIGSGGQDGIKVDLRHPASDEFGWRGSSSARLGLTFPRVWPAGASLTATALGPKKLDETDTDSEFTRFVATRRSEGVSFAPDFTLLTPSDVMLEVLDADGNVVKREAGALTFFQTQFPSKPGLPVTLDLGPLEAVPPCFLEWLLLENSLAWAMTWIAPRSVRLPDESVVEAHGVRWSIRGGRSPLEWAPPFRPSSQPALAVLAPGRLRTLTLLGEQVGELVVNAIEARRENPLLTRAHSGFAHAPLGNAQLATVPSGLAVANFTSSGEDGVKIDFGSVESWTIRLAPERQAYGGNLYLALFSDSGSSLGELNGEHLDSIVWRQRPGGDLSGFNQKLTLFGSGTFQITIHEPNLPPRVFPSVPASTSGGFSLRFLPPVIRASVEPDGRLKIVFETGNEQRPGSNPFANLDAGGQYFPMRVELLTAPGRVPPGTRLGRVEIRSRLMPALVFNGGSFQAANGLTFSGFGQSVIVPQAGGSLLEVAGSGTTGIDGVRVTRSQPTADVQFTADAVFGSATAAGGLAAAVYGAASTATPVGTFSAATTAGQSGLQLRATFPALGPGAPLLRVTDGDRIVTEVPNYTGGVSVRPVPSSGLAIASAGGGLAPVRDQSQLRAGVLANGALRLDQRWSEQRQISLADSTTVIGNRVSFIAEAVPPWVPSPLRLEIQLTNIPQLLVSGLAVSDTPPSTRRIFGRITDDAGTGVDGVSVALDGPTSAVRNTADGGHFEFSALPVAGPYRVQPAQTGLTFSPDLGTVLLLSDDAQVDFFSEPAAPPSLSIGRDQDGLVLSWPPSSASAGYVLEFTTSIGPDRNWQPVSPVPNGAAYRPPLDSDQKFFRLRRP